MTLLHQAAQKAVERIRHTLMTGLAHNDAIAALNELAALQQQPEPVAQPLADAEADAIHSMPWVRDCLLRYVDRPCDKEARDAVRAIVNAASGLMVGAMPALQHQEVPREPVARPSMSMYASAADYSAAMDGWIAATRQCPACKGKFGVDGQACDLCNATGRVPSTTQQQEVGSGWIPAPIEPTGEMLVAGWNAYLSDMKGGTERFAITYRAMLAAAPVSTRRQDVDSEWRPIESAPKDGLPLLLATDRGVVVIGKRNKHLHIWVEMDGRETPRQITYWKPLPAAPSTPEKAGGVSDGVGASPAPLHGIAANWFHGEGAIARCSYCSRYSLDPRTLSDRQPVCECGKRHGWSGSFEKPGPDAKWSGKAPAGVAIPLKESDRG